MHYDDYLTRVYSPEAFRGNVYGVTGGAHGIGQAIVRTLVSLGASVLVIDLNGPDLDYLVKDLDLPQQIEAVTANVADADALGGAIERAASRFGRLDGWVNNAMLSPRATLETQEESSFVRAWEVNVLAAWRAARFCLPHFRKAGRGSIVNISSIMAHMTRAQCAAYTSSKSALEGLTRELAVELAPDMVRVNTVAPGTIASYSTVPNDPTARHAYHKLKIEYEDYIGRFAQPLPMAAQSTEIAGPVLFYLSDASRFVTGTLLFCDGGARIQLPGDFDDHAERRSKIKAMREEWTKLQKQASRE